MKRTRVQALFQEREKFGKSTLCRKKCAFLDNDASCIFLNWSKHGNIQQHPRFRNFHEMDENSVKICREEAPNSIKPKEY